MNTSLEFWFDFSCPYAYLASRRAVELARAASVPLAWKPMLLGGVFRGVGAGDGPMATLGAAKAAHNLHDMQRWADLDGAPFRMPAAHPMRTVRALRVLLALDHSRWPDAIAALYAAYWQRADDITRDDTIAAALRAGGASDDDIRTALARADSQEIKDELRRRTDEAIALGIFGAPAWIVRREGGAELFWGRDRIPMVEAALGLQRTSDLGPRTSARGEHEVQLYFDVASPFAYLALTQASRLGDVKLVPILVGALFRDIGQADVPLFAMNDAKQRYTRIEMTRWARWWDVPFDMPTKFPQRTVTAQRLCVIAGERARPLAIALGRAMWAEQRDLEDDATLRAILSALALPTAWVERARDPDVKEALVANTAAARHAGVFGVPTWIVDGRHLFWGQDRIELVARALDGWTPP